jgi:excisionase family DNA binding protein
MAIAEAALPPLLTVEEAATVLRVSKWSIYKHTSAGRLRAVRVAPGSSIRIRADDLVDLIEAKTTREDPS